MSAPGGGAGRFPQACRGWCCEEAHQAVERGDRRQQGVVGLASCTLSPTAIRYTCFTLSSSEPWAGGTVLVSHPQPRTQPELCRHAGAAGAVLHEPQGDRCGQPAQGKWTHRKGGGGLVLPWWSQLPASSEAYSFSHLKLQPFVMIYEF